MAISTQDIDLFTSSSNVAALFGEPSSNWASSFSEEKLSVAPKLDDEEEEEEDEDEEEDDEDFEEDEEDEEGDDEEEDEDEYEDDEDEDEDDEDEEE